MAFSSCKYYQSMKDTLSTLQKKAHEEFERRQGVLCDYPDYFGSCSCECETDWEKVLAFLDSQIEIAYNQGWADSEKNTADAIDRVNTYIKSSSTK